MTSERKAELLKWADSTRWPEWGLVMYHNKATFAESMELVCDESIPKATRDHIYRGAMYYSGGVNYKPLGSMPPTILLKSPRVIRSGNNFLIKAQTCPEVVVGVGASEQRVREWLPGFGYNAEEIEQIVEAIRGQE